MIQYTIAKGNISKTFIGQEQLSTFLAANPDWVGLPIEEKEYATPVPFVQVPQSVPLWCLRTILIAMGLLDTVKQTIASMPEGTLKIAAEQGIEYSNTVLRNSPTTLFIQQVLQLTSEQVDQIFIEADKVEA